MPGFIDVGKMLWLLMTFQILSFLSFVSANLPTNVENKNKKKKKCANEEMKRFQSFYELRANICSSWEKRRKSDDAGFKSKKTAICSFPFCIYSKRQQYTVYTFFSRLEVHITSTINFISSFSWSILSAELQSPKSVSSRCQNNIKNVGLYISFLYLLL